MASMNISVGQIAVGTRSDILTTSGVGSCVVVVLYDRKQKVGAMAHALLSSAVDRSRPSPLDTQYVEAAIDAMIAELGGGGAEKERLVAKLVGGANMFAEFGADIGARNVAAAREKLKAEGIEVVEECVGGVHGRSVEFCAASGVMSVIGKF